MTTSLRMVLAALLSHAIAPPAPASALSAVASTGAPTGALAMVATWGDTRLRTAEAAVRVMAIPGTSWFATTSRRALILWSWRTGDQVMAFHLEVDAPILAVAGDGRTLAADRTDDETAIFDLQAKRLIKVVPGGRPLFLSMDGALLATFHQPDSTYQLWDVGKGQKLWERKGRRPDLPDGAFDGPWLSAPEGMMGFVASVDGRFAAAISVHRSACELLVMDLRTLAPRYTAPLGKCPQTVRFAGNHRVVAAGAEAVVWDFEQSKLPRTVPLEDVRRTDHASISPDENRVVLWDVSQLGVWDAKSGKRLWTVRRPPSDQSQRPDAAFSPDGRHLIASGWGRGEELVVWEAATGRKIFARGDLYSRLGHNVAFDATGARLAAGGPHNLLTLLALASGAEDPPRPQFSGAATALALSHDGRLLATGTGDGSVVLRDTTTGSVSHVLHAAAAGDAAVEQIAFSADGAEVAAVIGDLKLRRAEIWGVASGESRRSVTMPGRSPPARIQILPGAERIVVEETRAAEVGELQDGAHIMTAFELATGKRLSSWRAGGPDDGLLLGQVSPDGSWAAVAGAPRGLRIVDLATGAAVRSFDLPPAQSATIALSPDGRSLAALAQDGTTSVLDARSGTALRSWKGSGGYCSGMAFSPDGRWLAISQWTGALQLWDVSLGTLTGTWDLGSRVDFPSSLLFTADGGHLLVGTGRGLVFELAAGPRAGK